MERLSAKRVQADPAYARMMLKEFLAYARTATKTGAPETCCTAPIALSSHSYLQLGNPLHKR